VSRVDTGPSARGSAVLVVRLALISGLNYGFGLVLAWLLLPAEFGKVAIAQTILWLGAILLNAGFPWLAAILVARSSARDAVDAGRVRGLIAGNLALAVAIAGIVLLLGLTSRIWPDAGSPVGLLATLACFPVFALNSVARGLLQGAVRFGAIAAYQVVEVVVKFGVGIVLVAGFGLGADAVPVAFLLGALAGLAISASAARDLTPAWGRFRLRSEYVTAAPMLIGASGVALLVTVDVLLLAGVRELVGLTTAGIAVYQVAAIIARTPYFVGDALTDASFPYIAKAASPSASQRQMQVVTRRIALWVVPLELALLFRPQPLVHAFFPHHYEDATSIVRLLALGTLGAVVANALGKALQARDLRHEAAGAVALGVGVQVVAVVAGVALWGTRGAAAGFALGTWTAALALGRRYAAVDGHAVPTEIFRRAAPAVLAASAVLLLPADGTVLVGLIQIATALALYFATLVVTRLISTAEVARIAGAISGASRRGEPAPRKRRGDGGVAAFVRRPRLVVGLTGLISFLILGANVARSPDTIYDEAVYTRAAQAVANHGEVTWTGAPLFVHPPLYFVLQAVVQRIAGVARADYFDVLHVERLVSVAFMTGAIVLLMLIALRLASPLAPGRRLLFALGVGTLATFDPVLVRYGRLTMLESTALCLGLAAIWASLALHGRRAGRWIATVGLLSGVALLVKEISIFLIVAPLLTALFDREREAIRRSAAALGVALLVWSSFPVWAILLGDWGQFTGDKLRTLDRLLGVVQTTGWNRPGVSITDALTTSLPQYASSYVLLVTGGAALVWLWLRHGGRTANFLLGLLLPTYALGVYSVTRGQFNEQFFTYLRPGAILATAVGAQLLIARALSAPGRASASRRIGVGAVAVLAVVLAFGMVSWSRYQAFGSDDAVRQAAAFVRTELPRCAVVNASGDHEKYATASGRRFSEFASGPAALSHGVHYFLVSPKDVTARYTNMTPALADWVRGNGRLLRIFPGRTYQGIELWYVSGTGVPVTDVQPVNGGVFVATRASACGGVAVRDDRSGAFASAFIRLGGRGRLGPPVSRRFTLGRRTVQAFEGLVLAAAPDPTDPAARRPARPYPIVAIAAHRSGGILDRAGMRVGSGATTTDRRRLVARLSDRDFAHYYLGTNVARASAARWHQARTWLGLPLGAPRVEDGVVRQAFSNAVLERTVGSPSVRLGSRVPLYRATSFVPTSANRTRPVPDLDTRVRRFDDRSDVAPFLALVAAAVALSLGLCLGFGGRDGPEGLGDATTSRRELRRAAAAARR
jgi:O-antigen/teichoic acid export membrane protein/4-amino-4-deoxy-L-arabinose transferase-like glycosyltransferase